MGDAYIQFFKEIEKFKRIRGINKCSDNILFEYVLCTKIFQDIKNDVKVSFFSYFRKIIRVLFFRVDYSIKEINSQQDETKKNVLFHRTSIKREDYLVIENRTIEAISPFYNVDIMVKEHKRFDRRFVINAWSILKCYYFLKQARLKNPFDLALDLSEITKSCSEFNKLFTSRKYSKLITFCDIHVYDNLITQYARKWDIETITLQHGMFNFESYKYDDINALHCIMSISDKNLVWGNFTKEQFVASGKKGNQVFLVGNPKLQQTNTIVYDNYDKAKKSFIVFLDHNDYISSNTELISIASRLSDILNCSYIVKMHPYNSTKHYEQYLNANCIRITKEKIDYYEIIQTNKFALCHNTAMYYEMVYFGLPTFRYKDKTFSDIDNINNKFRNFDELLVLLRDYFDLGDDRDVRELANYYYYKGDYEESVLVALESRTLIIDESGDWNEDG